MVLPLPTDIENWDPDHADRHNEVNAEVNRIGAEIDEGRLSESALTDLIGAATLDGGTP